MIRLNNVSNWVTGRLNKVGIFMAEVAKTALILNLAGAGLIYVLRRVRYIPSLTADVFVIDV